MEHRKLNKYNFETTLIFTTYGIEAETVEEARKILNESFFEEFGFEVSEEESKLLVEEDVE